MLVRLITTPWVERHIWPPPIGIASLAASLRAAGIEARCLDLNESMPDACPFPFELVGADDELDGAAKLRSGFPQYLGRWAELALEASPQMVGLSVLYRSMLAPALALAREIRAKSPGTLIVMGGAFATKTNHAMAARILESGAADVVARGEGEQTIVELARARGAGSGFEQVRGIWFLKEGKAASTEDRPPADVSSLPFPVFDDFARGSYEKAWAGFPIHSSRGCVNSCTFCNSRRYSPFFRQRAAESVLNEIRRDVEVYGIRRLAFTDNLVNGNPRVFKDICRGIAAGGWGLEVFVSLALMPSVDSEMLDLMKAAGVTHAMLALESPSVKVRGDMGKWQDMRGVLGIFKGCVSRGIKPWAYLMHSFPTESEQDFLDLLHFVDDWKPSEMGGVMSWPFRLADVQLGELDKAFISRFGIEILEGRGQDVPRYWTVFGNEPRWRTKFVDEEIRRERQERVDRHLECWLAKN